MSKKDLNSEFIPVFKNLEFSKFNRTIYYEPKIRKNANNIFKFLKNKKLLSKDSNTDENKYLKNQIKKYYLTNNNFFNNYNNLNHNKLNKNNSEPKLLNKRKKNLKIENESYLIFNNKKIKIINSNRFDSLNNLDNNFSLKNMKTKFFNIKSIKNFDTFINNNNKNTLTYNSKNFYSPLSLRTSSNNSINNFKTERNNNNNNKILKKNNSYLFTLNKSNSVKTLSNFNTEINFALEELKKIQNKNKNLFRILKQSNSFKENNNKNNYKKDFISIIDFNQGNKKTLLKKYFNNSVFNIKKIYSKNLFINYSDKLFNMSSKNIKKYEKDFKINLKKQKNNMGIDIIKKLNGNELKINKNILNNIDILKEKLKINLKKINKLNYNNKFYKNQVENIFNKFKNDNNLIKFS
jgi:hypothetical protein